MTVKQVRKVAERCVKDVIEFCSSVVVTRMAEEVVKEAAMDQVDTLQFPLKVLLSVNGKLAVRFVVIMLTMAFGDRVDLKNDGMKLAAVAQLCSQLRSQELVGSCRRLLTEALNQADLCHILSLHRRSTLTVSEWRFHKGGEMLHDEQGDASPESRGVSL